jgi:hypothetical protein
VEEGETVTVPWYLYPARLVSTVWWYVRYEVGVTVAQRNGLDAFTLQRAAQLYGEGEISGGRFRELAREWAMGVDIEGQVRELEQAE